LLSVLVGILFLPSLVFGKTLDIPFKSQVPPGIWTETRNCGQASFLMIEGYYNNFELNEESIKKLDDWLYEEYGDSQRGYSGQYTNVTKIKKISVDYSDFNLDDVSIRNDGDWNYLKEQIEAKNPVIVAVYTNMLRKGTSRDVKHFMVLTGFEGNKIFVNDPGKKEGKNNEYSKEEFINAWSKNGFAAIIFNVNKPEPESTQPTEKSWWQKFLNLFGENEEVQTEGEQEVSASGDEQNNQTEEEQFQNEEAETGSYSLQFLESRQTASVSPGEVINLEVKVKNTGTADWQKNNISLNVVGGLAKNAEYHHSSWVTSLRPALLQVDVPAGEVGTFLFSINTLAEVGEYNFKVQAVRIDDNFKYIEGGFWEIDLQVEEPTVQLEAEQAGEEDPVETSLGTSQNDDEEKQTIVEKIVEKVEEVVEGVKETVKQIFYGGGGGGSLTPAPEPEPEVVVASPEILVTSHSTSTEYTASSTAMIAGTKNEATETVYINTSTAEIVSSIAWQLEVELAEGENIFAVYGENSVSEKTVTTTLSLFLDITAPDLPVVTAIQSEYATPTLYISWSSVDAGSGVESYDIEYSSSTDWQVFATSTKSTGYSMTAVRLGEYGFRVRAYDTLGNVSEWSTSTSIVADWPKDVVINEIGWMGSGPSTKQKNDEWIELYNNTETDIDIAGWQVLINGVSVYLDEINNTIIPAQGYLLLEKDEDNTINLIPADIIYTGAMADEGEELVLQDENGSVVDMVDCQTGWFAGSMENNQHRSMARVDSNAPGSFPSNWQTYRGLAPVARSMSGSDFYGSPGYVNTGYWRLAKPNLYYADEFDESNIWILTVENSPYVIDYETEIPVGYKIIVEPGVVLYGRYRSSYFKVLGELELNGTADNPIIFTSALDNNYVETNRSLIGGVVSPGDWSRIQVEPGGSLQASYTKFLYGGQTSYSSPGAMFTKKYFSNVISNFGAVVDLENTEFRYNYIDPDEKKYLRNSVIWTQADTGSNSTTTVSNSIFVDGWKAVENYGQNNGQKINSSITNNTFQNFSNPDGAIKFTRDFPILANNIFDNADAYFDFGSQVLAGDLTLSTGMNYYFSSLNIPVGKTLTVEPGVNIKILTSIVVDGSLQILGSSDSYVNIIPQNENWGQMIFNNSNSTIDYANIMAGKAGSYIDEGMIIGNNSILNFNNVTFSDARRPYNMIYLNNSITTIFNSEFSWSSDYTGSKTVNGIKLDGGNLLLDNVNFNNMHVGVEVRNEGVLDMQNMTADNFQNVTKYKWWPESVWAF